MPKMVPIEPACWTKAEPYALVLSLRPPVALQPPWIEAWEQALASSSQQALAWVWEQAWVWVQALVSELALVQPHAQLPSVVASALAAPPPPPAPPPPAPPPPASPLSTQPELLPEPLPETTAPPGPSGSPLRLALTQVPLLQPVASEAEASPVAVAVQAWDQRRWRLSPQSWQSTWSAGSA